MARYMSELFSLSKQIKLAKINQIKKVVKNLKKITVDLCFKANQIIIPKVIELKR